MERLMRASLLLLAAALLCPPADAALPPEAAAARKLSKMSDAATQRAAAPEVIVLTVLSREIGLKSRSSCSDTLTWTVSVQVVEVTRSVAGLAPGDVITLQYDTEYQPPGSPCGGPMRYAFEDLNVGDTRPAWLGASEGTYYPAAGAWSFTAEDDFNNEYLDARAR